MAQFAGFALRGQLDRTVVDKTGITGRFDIHLKYLLGSGKVSTAASGADGTSIFVALQEQLGLKLVSGTGPVEVLVIDHVERPSEN